MLIVETNDIDKSDSSSPGLSQGWE